jgi:hypothetical protein
MRSFSNNGVVDFNEASIGTSVDQRWFAVIIQKLRVLAFSIVIPRRVNFIPD